MKSKILPVSDIYDDRIKEKQTEPKIKSETAAEGKRNQKNK